MVYGVHKPTYRSDEAVIRYADRLGAKEAIYRVNDFSARNRKEYRYIGNAIPDVLLYNSAGQLTTFDIDCSNDLKSVVVLSLPAIDNLPVKPNSVHDFLDDTYVINELVGKNSPGNRPLYVVKFAEYAGLLNKDNVPALVAILKNRNDVQYVLLNVDYTLSD